MNLPFSNISKIISFQESEFELNKRNLSPKSTWYLFDVDNTLITPNLTDSNNYNLALQATDAYFYQEMEKYFKENRASLGETKAKLFAYRTVIKQFNDAHLKDPPMIIMEDGLDEWVASLQSRNFLTMGFTARESSLCEITEKQLIRVGISFQQSPIAKESFHLIHRGYEDLLLKGGIYYVGRGGPFQSNHKGKKFKILLTILIDSVKLPKTIVFFDDRAEHVLGMEKELLDCGINYLGFHYERVSEIGDSTTMEILQ